MQAPLAWRGACGITRLLALGYFLAFAGAAIAGGGNVLPPTAKVHGYSLAAAAGATAYFNVGPRTPDTLPAGFPFQILYFPDDQNLTFNVRTGTMFYVPVVYSDSNDAAFWPFPDLTDPQAVSDYYFDPAQLGAEYIDIVVDGKINSLGPSYAVGAVTPSLPSGANSYTVAAAFLAPMSKGTHTVTIRGLLSGDFIGGSFSFETTYIVNVR